MAVKGPVAGGVRRQIEADFYTRHNIDGMLHRVTPGMTVHHREEVTVQMDRVLHHRVVHQRYPHALIPSKADRLHDRAELAAVERPHESFNIAGEMDFHSTRRLTRVGVWIERDEIGIDEHAMPHIAEAGGGFPPVNRNGRA